MKVSILSIGTELTTGQIINKNSAWIASQLKKQSLDSTIHITAPDEKEIILKSLNTCALLTDLIFITGGLGPTSDDFTRNVISEWTQKKLVFDENSWEQIKQILNSRSVVIKDIQKQQCYFPEDSVILKNNKGTANAFSLDCKYNNKNIKLFVLPGPPLEIETIWTDHISDWLEKATVYVDKITTHSWDTIGVPESEVAAITEFALIDLKKDFPITIGYRAHLPYVEVKMTYPSSVDFTAKLFKDKLDEKLSSITVLKNFEKISDLFSDLVKNKNFAFYDFCTNGYLHQSLSTILRKHSEWMWKQSTEVMDSDFFSEEENFIALFKVHENSNKSETTCQCQIMADFNGRKMIKTVELPHRFLSMPERQSSYFSEMAMLEFVKFYRN